MNLKQSKARFWHKAAFAKQSLWKKRLFYCHDFHDSWICM